MATRKPSLLFITLLLLYLTTTTATTSHFEGFEAEEEPEIPLSDLPHRSHPPPTTLTTFYDHSPPSEPEPEPNPQPSPPSPPFEYWDEDEFEGFPVEAPTPTEPINKPELNKTPEETTEHVSEHVPKHVSSYAVEIFCILFIVTFAVNYFIGKNENERLALAWTTKFATKDTIFDKNFSLLGVGEGEDDAPLLLKEGQNVFKFYASGRRFCQGLVATMELKSRHDLIARSGDLVVMGRDEISIEVFMNDDAMDHVVFALAKKRNAKSMVKEVRDLQRFGSLMTSGVSGRKWIADELAVIAESKEVAGDLMNESVIDQVFGEKAFEKFGKWFISMHFSDQHQSTHRKMLIFKFALPDANHMADMTKLVALVPYYIDLIGRYKLSSQARSKTEAARLKVAQEMYKGLQNARQETLQRKKAERRKMMEEAESKLNAEVLRKREAKEHARQLKKAMPKIKMSRGG